MDLYFWGGIIIAVLSFIIGLIWFCYRAGRNASRVQSERQNLSQADAQNATLSRMNEAAASAPQTDDELMAKLRDGKEGQ